MARRLSPSEKKAQRQFAVECFNDTWKLLLKKRRTKAEDLEMVHMAHASRYHWGLVGNARNLAVGEWQISRVYAVLQRPEPALLHAKEALRTCLENGINDFPRAYAYEALARASAIAGKKRDAARYLRLGNAAGAKIKEKEDRDLFFSDLKTVPGYRTR